MKVLRQTQGRQIKPRVSATLCTESARNDKKMKEFKEMLEGKNVGDRALRFLKKLDKEKGINDIAVCKADPEAVAALTSRNQWGMSGGIGYYDQVRLYYHGQTEMVEFNWRDQYSAANDRPRLKVNSIGGLTISASGEKVRVSVKLKNSYGTRTHSFKVSPAEPPAETDGLSADQSKKFKAAVNAEVERIKAELLRLWEFKPKMMASYPGSGTGYVKYRTPLVKTPEFNGPVAAFVTIEQIDHDCSDPQMRYELRVMRFGEEHSEVYFEDHAYEKREGRSAGIAIVTIGKNTITVSTDDGIKEVPLK